MPEHMRQQIADALEAALKGRTSAGPNVFQGRTWPIDAQIATDTLILIYARGGASRPDAQADADADQPLDRDERVVVEGIIRTTGVEPERAMNRMAAAIEPLVMRDAALGALLEIRQLIATELNARLVGEGREGTVKLTYRIVYRTNAGDPTVKV